MIDDRLYADPDLVQFYDLDNVWGPDDDWCVRFAEGARSVLDLGCGTGRLAAALAAGGRSVVGVEPAVAMLEVARRRSGGEGVAWVEADAREVRLGRCFDAVLLTGHTFQVFLTGADQRAVLRTVAAHLGPEGRFVLDTRNPEAKAWRAWRPGHSERVLDHPRLGKVKAWNDAAHDAATGVVTYRTFYQAEGEEQLFSATSRIGFASKEELAGLLDEAGLFAED